MTIRSTVSLMVDGLKSAKQNMEIRNRLRQQSLGLISLDVIGLGSIEETLGRRVCETIISAIKRQIVELDRVMGLKAIAVKSMGDDFSVFVEMPMTTGGLSRDRYLYEEGDNLKRALEQRVSSTIGIDVRLHMGSSILDPTSDKGFQSVLYKAMKSANVRAKSANIEEQFLLKEFREILAAKRLATHFQPIFSLTTGEPLAYEALTRGPEGTEFRFPDKLFTFAQKMNQLTNLDRLALETAIRTFAHLPAGSKLFVNVDSRTIMEPTFTVQTMESMLENTGLTSHDIVLEITERNWVGDYADFNSRLEPYRNAGYSIAVDDAGMGYSSLQAITELRPDYIKIDKSLTQHINREMVKSAMLETLVDFARKVNSFVIAEGVETTDELSKLIHLGIDFGQGYLLRRPSPPSLIHDLGSTRDLILSHTSQDSDVSDETVTVDKLTREVHTFSENARVSDVTQYFHANEDHPCVVIARGERPIGLVTRDKLMRHLATQYGVPLYWHRPISKLMDSAPLIIESTMALDVASRLSMEREQSKVYDSIIVTQAGELAGVITIQDILSTINTIQLERARGSNPLTGLPGNRTIKSEIRSWMGTGKQFFIVYADIDHFKWFNDRFGFHEGDHVIQFLSDLLTDVCRTGDHHPCFVGHVGGDDFIVITDNPLHPAWCDEVIRLFDRDIAQFYGSENRMAANGELAGFQVVDRNGNPVSADGLTLSLSILTCPPDITYLTLEDVITEVARVKKIAKQRRGGGSTCIGWTIGADVKE